jgi:Phytanoyl-CoA dioxygenase (PhyH)
VLASHREDLYVQLSEAQRAAFYRDGYVRVPGAIVSAHIERALTAINADLGRGLDASRIGEFYARSFCPELRSSPAVLDLFRATPARQLVDSLLAPGRVREPDLAQIALRFPRGADAPELPALPRPHIDGTYGPSNGVRPGQVAHFTLLCMVALSDVSADFAGNFSVWPGTHQLYERYFQTHDVREMRGGTPQLEALPRPVQLQVQAGDLVLAHYQLGHAAAPNLSAHVRYAVFFRLYHEHHDPEALDILADIWREFPGLQRFSREP